MKSLKQMIAGCILIWQGVSAQAQSGFVALPSADHPASAYVMCNPTGEHGLTVAGAPDDDKRNACAVSGEALTASPLNAPVEGFKLKGMLVRDVEMPKSDAGAPAVVAVLTDAIWRNKENTECVLGTHLQMKDAPLADGSYWEVNDIARGGFAGKEVAIAYFYKPHSQEVGGDTEVLFRAGRTFTSAKTTPDTKMLPSTDNAPAVNVPINDKNAAAISDNWVDFTTDLSFKDLDGSTRAISSIFYIKYACDVRDPVEQPNAIHLRTTGQSGQKTREIAVPGLVPADAVVEKY